MKARIVADRNRTGGTPLSISPAAEGVGKILLMQSVFEAAPNLLPREAVQKAESQWQPEHPAERNAVRVSEKLLEYLPPAYRRLAEKPFRLASIFYFIPLMAFLLGALSNSLSLPGSTSGVSRAIHVLVNPIVMLMLWNIAMVLIFMALHYRSAIARWLTTPEAMEQIPGQRYSRHENYGSREDSEIVISSPGGTSSPKTGTRSGWRKPEPDLPILARIVLRPVLRLWASFVDSVAYEAVSTATHVTVAQVFLSRCYRAYRSNVAARLEIIVNLSAICLAAGAIAGMYVQAVLWDYTFFWKSTLVESPETRLMIAKTLFWPAALLLGSAFPSVAGIAETGQGIGLSGAIWIHVFTVSAIMYILIPRLVLICRTALRTSRSSSTDGITVDFIHLYKEPAPSDLEKRYSLRNEDFLPARGEAFKHNLALDYFSLNADAISVMSSLESALIELDIRNTRAGNLGDPLTAKRNWYLGWLKLVKRGFENLPASEGPGLYEIDSESFRAAVERVSHSSNPFSRQLILLELAAFEAYWPLAAPGEKSWTDRLRGLAEFSQSLDRDLVNRFLENASFQLGLTKDKGPLLREELKNVNRSLSGYWKTVAIVAGFGTVAGALSLGIAAPFIGGLIGHAMGLAGAAAVKAGLAALGAGAVAGGGMGVAGGTAVIFGGGALLGMGVGSSVAASMNPAGVLIQAAKIEVFLEQVVSEHDDAKRVVEDVLRQLEASIAAMDDELKNARLDQGIGSNSIAEREKMMDILRACLKRCTDWANKSGFL